MLSKILSRRECAECRICCSFDSYDLWDTPVISDETAERIREVLPEQEFSFSSGARRLVMMAEEDRDVYYCPLLDHKKGCMLGDEKPFECSIWPLGVQRFGGRRVIVLSPVCPNIYGRSVRRVRETAKELAKRIFEEADNCPGLVKPYAAGYIILLVEEDRNGGI